MRKIREHQVAAAVLLSALAFSSQATTWAWSFGTEHGTFVTSGTDSTAGTYEVLDFSVTASGYGATLGSLNGGAYETGAFDTNAPFRFEWNGTAVTRWLHGGGNLYDWNLYHDTAQPDRYYAFGMDGSFVNVTTSAAYVRLEGVTGQALVSAPFTVVAIPEPASLALMLGGLGLLALRHSRSAATGRR